MSERLLPQRRRKRGVDEREGAAQCAQFVEVDQFQQRVRRSLGDREHRAPGPQRGGERARFGAVDEGDLDAEAGTWPLQESEGGRVQLALSDDVVAGAAQGKDDGTDRAHTAGEGE